MLLLESFPPILLTMSKSYRDTIARYRQVSNDSVQTEIPKNDAAKKKYNEELLVYSLNGRAFAYGEGTMVSVMNDQFTEIAHKAGKPIRRRGGTNITRADCIEIADQVFVISRDESVRDVKRGRNENRPLSTEEEGQAAFKARAKALFDAYIDKVRATVTRLKDELVALDAELLADLPDRILSGKVYSTSYIFGSGPRSEYRDKLIKRIYAFNEVIGRIRQEGFTEYVYGDNGGYKFDPAIAAKKLSDISTQLQRMAA